MACGLRADTCPFAALGCMAEGTEVLSSACCYYKTMSLGIAHRDLPNHMDQCVQSHLMLTLSRLVEQQTVIKRLHREVTHLTARHLRDSNCICYPLCYSMISICKLDLQVHDLTGRVDGHDKSIIALDAAAVTTALAVRNAKKEALELQEKTAKNVEKRVERDLKSVAKDVSKMNQTVNELKKKSTTAAAAPPPAAVPSTVQPPAASGGEA